jgi:pimeloyl-ACP methyl ester carboxylesterase
VPEIVRESEDEIEGRSRELLVRIPKRSPFEPNAAFVEKKLVGESCFFPREDLAAYSRSLLPIPQRLLFERQNVRGAQLRLSGDVEFPGTPVLVITGTEDVDHRPALDEAIVRWLNERGARAEFCYLGDIGIRGNGHMLMLEENSGQIADVIVNWLAALS